MKKKDSNYEEQKEMFEQLGKAKFLATSHRI